MRKLLVIVTLFIGSYVFYYYLDYLNTKTADFTFIDTKNQPFLGNGTITLVAFQDFRCPGCKSFYDRIYPKIKKRYIDTNKIRYVVIPIAFLPGSKEATKVALSVYAVNNKDFFSYIKILYQTYQSYSVDTIAQLVEKTSKIPGLSVSAVKRKMVSLDHETLLRQNLEQAKKAMGKVATPGIFVDGVDISDHSLREMIQYLDHKVWAASVK